MTDMETVKARYPDANHWKCDNGYHVILDGERELGASRYTKKIAWAQARAFVEKEITQLTEGR